MAWALLALAACGEAGPEAAPAPSASPRVEGASEASPSASLDVSTLPGAIVFVSERDGNLEVYRWRAHAALERLTDDPRADFVGEVPRGGGGWTRVVTTDGATPESHREQLMWMPSEGEPIEIGPPGRRSRGASWSPDRAFVVFESDADDAFSDLWRWDRGGASTRLTRTEHGAFEPAVSPDGRSIAFVSSQDGNPEIYRMNADGSDPQRLTSWRRDDLAPQWSPDGRSLAFLRRERGGERLFVLELRDDGTAAERRLVPTAEAERVKHADHRWSPDGTQLAYAVHRPGEAPRVVVTDWPTGTTRTVSPPKLRATMPSWSPDGRHLVFAGTEADPNALDLYVVALDGGAWARLTDAPASDWLPRWTRS